MLSHTESNRPSRGDPVVVCDDRRVGVFVLQRAVHSGIGRGDEPEDEKERRAVARGRGTGKGEEREILLFSFVSFRFVSRFWYS